VLEGLDDVAWDRLGHAYGPATDVPDLLRAVADGDVAAMTELFATVVHSGTVYAGTVPAVPFLIELLDVATALRVDLLLLLSDIARGYSHEAGEAGEDIERAARAAVAAGTPSYLRLLTDDAAAVRAEAAHTLGSCLEPADPAVSTILERIDDDDAPLVRAGLIFAAGMLGAATPQGVAGWLADPDPVARVAAAVVATDAPGQPSDAALTVLERDAPPSIRALQTLPDDTLNPALNRIVERLTDRWEPQIRLLYSWIGHPDPRVRYAAIFAMEYPVHVWRPAPARLVPALARCLSDPERDVRRAAVLRLAQSGRAAAAAADELWALVEREPAGEPASANAVRALCGLRDPRAAAYLAQRLAAQPLDVSGLYGAIERLGPWAEACREPLIRAVPVVPAGHDRIAVIAAVGRLCAGAAAAATEAVPALRAQLAQDPRIATRVLGDLGPYAIGALPDLHTMLDHQDAIVRVNVARALVRIGADLDTALPVLRAAIDDDGAGHRSHALRALGEIGPAAAELASLLPPLFDSTDEWVAVPSATAYLYLTGDPVPVVPILLRHLYPRVWGLDAVRCLADIGPAARAAVPALQHAATSERRHITTTGVDTLVDEDELWADLCAAALDRIADPRPS